MRYWIRTLCLRHAGIAHGSELRSWRMLEKERMLNRQFLSTRYREYLMRLFHLLKAMVELSQVKFKLEMPMTKDIASRDFSASLRKLRAQLKVWKISPCSLVRPQPQHLQTFKSRSGQETLIASFQRSSKVSKTFQAQQKIMQTSVSCQTMLKSRPKLFSGQQASESTPNDIRVKWTSSMTSKFL